MPRKKDEQEVIKELGDTVKFLLRMETDLYDRVKMQSLRRYSMSATAYIRMAIIERLEKDEMNEASLRKKFTTR